MNEQFRISQNTTPPTNTTFTSWKEVAAYLGKGVRTVQRWEHRFGLPVRRPTPNSHVILALSGEVDAWVRRQRYFRGTRRQARTIASNKRVQHEQLTNTFTTAVTRFQLNQRALACNMMRLQTAIAGINKNPNGSSHQRTTRTTPAIAA